MAAAPESLAGAQDQINHEFWARGGYIKDYTHRVLHPAEVLLLVRYREQLSGRTLEIGCGAGRILGYLIALGGESHGVDISPEMVEYCHRVWPEASVRTGDLTALGEVTDGVFDALFAADNVLDVLSLEPRRAALAAWRELLAPGGVLIFSSHNLAAADPDRRLRAPAAGNALVARLRRALHHTPAWMLQAVLRLRLRAANRRRLAPLTSRADDHAVLNDLAHDFSLLHFYVQRDAQERMLNELGYELLECLQLDGHPVPAGAEAHGPSLYYVARAR